MKSIIQGQSIGSFYLIMAVSLFILGCREGKRDSFSSCDNDFQGKPFNKEVIGFYPYWKERELQIESVQWQYLTRIIYAFAKPEADGGLNASNLDSRKLVEYAHENGVEAYFSIGGGSDKSLHFRTVTTDAQKRNRFVNEIVAYAETFCYDGVDIDWEYLSYSNGKNITTAEKQGLVLLLKELKTQLLPLGKQLSIDVYGSVWAGGFFSDEIPLHVDQIHIMAYDYSGKWSEPQPHSSVEQAFGKNGDKFPSGVHYWEDIRHWPKEKLYLGLPFYGRDFGHPSVKGKAYKEIVEEYPDSHNRSEINQIYYNGQPIIQEKCERVIQKGLPGVMIWELSQDAKGEASLLKTVEMVFQNEEASQ